MVVLTTINDLSYGVEEAWMDTIIKKNIREAWIALFEKRAKEYASNSEMGNTLKFSNYLAEIGMFNIVLIEEDSQKILEFNRYYGENAFSPAGFGYTKNFTLTQFLDWVEKRCQ